MIFLHPKWNSYPVLVLRSSNSRHPRVLHRPPKPILYAPTLHAPHAPTFPGTAGTVRDGCGTVAKVRIARVHRAWDGGTAVHTPLPPTTRRAALSAMSPSDDHRSGIQPSTREPARKESHLVGAIRSYSDLIGATKDNIF
jgi:hypothetical protein